MNNEPQYLTRPDAAALIGIGVSTLRLYIRMGWLKQVSMEEVYPGVPHGRGEPPMLISRADAIAFRDGALKQHKIDELRQKIARYQQELAALEGQA